jgi:diguanylate cyclase (GGDEF)-like protein
MYYTNGLIAFSFIIVYTTVYCVNIKENTNRLHDLANTDYLTGLYNRQYIQKLIYDESHKNVAIMDVDHFKNINDTYGHACGDVILKSVSQTIRGLLRKYDVFARYGGEEFLTLLPETDLEGATIVAERFRKQIEKMTVRYADFTIKITITLGVAKYDHRLGADRSIQMADKALYQGKEGGRNRVVVWNPEWVTDADYEAAAIEQAAQKKNSEKASDVQVSLDYLGENKANKENA